jgi:hypothetical protein
MSGALTAVQLQGLLQETAFEAITLNQEKDGEMFVRMVVTCRRAKDG